MTPPLNATVPAVRVSVVVAVFTVIAPLTVSDDVVVFWVIPVIFAPIAAEIVTVPLPAPI